MYRDRVTSTDKTSWRYEYIGNKFFCSEAAREYTHTQSGMLIWCRDVLNLSFLIKKGKEERKELIVSSR
jgi:hypothetical protein